METESRPVHDAPDFSMVALSTAASSDCESLFSPFDLATSQNSAFPWDSSTWDYPAPPLSHSDTSPSSLNVSDLETEITPPALEMVFASMHKDDGGSKHACRAPTTVKCACGKPHLQITAYELGPDGRREVTLLNIGATVPPKAALVTPDPYINHIRLDSVCTLAAMDTLRMQVGITDNMMCSGDYPSPFYRPIRASAQNDPRRNMVHAVQKTFKALQPDLRPIPEQIIVGHPPYIDALPFRQLRKNLILRHDEINPEEFLRDVVTGLVCWGGGGLGRKDRDASTGDASVGTPWDHRSWEAKVWFLRKYWSVLGGEEGELVRQSQWWRGIRGEEDSLDMEEAMV
jgi:hypothetical protein